MVEEDKRNKLPANYEAKKARAEWILENEESRQKAAEEGQDYNRIKMLTVGADEAERKEKKNRKKNPDTGFADFEQATIRQVTIVISFALVIKGLHLILLHVVFTSSIRDW